MNGAWIPTPDALASLPEGARRYISDLEANRDPEGLIRKIALLEDQRDQLGERVKRLHGVVFEMNQMAQGVLVG